MNKFTEWHGVPESECRHGTTGSRALCYTCAQWCYPDMPCKGCEVSQIRTALATAEERAERAEAEVAAVRKIHRPQTIAMSEWACYNGDDCGHDDECPLTDIEVCRECWNLWTQDGRDDEVPADDQVCWPCATAKALVTLQATPEQGGTS